MWFVNTCLHLGVTALLVQVSSATNAHTDEVCMTRRTTVSPRGAVPTHYHLRTHVDTCKVYVTKTPYVLHAKHNYLTRTNGSPGWKPSLPQPRLRQRPSPLPLPQRSMCSSRLYVHCLNETLRSGALDLTLSRKGHDYIDGIHHDDFHFQHSYIYHYLHWVDHHHFYVNSRGPYRCTHTQWLRPYPVVSTWRCRQEALCSSW